MRKWDWETILIVGGGIFYYSCILFVVLKVAYVVQHFIEKYW